MNKAYLKYIVVFIGLLLIIDIVSGKIFKESFQNISFGTYGEINEALKSQSNLLILGSSRAKHHYDPIQFEKSFKMETYNSGLGGQGLFYNYAILKERIKISKPKIVILDIAPNVIVDKESYSKLNLLLPYYNDYPAFKEIIRLDSKFSNLELLSNLYVYNSTLYDYLRSIFLEPKLDNLGFEPLKGEINKSKYVPFYLQNEEIDINKAKYLNKIIELCNEYDIRLITVISPTYEKFDRENKIINKYKTILRTKEVEFYDYSNYEGLYLKPQFFTDQLHLNSEGANLFSKEIGKKLNEFASN